MTIAFRYRRRKGDPALLEARVGETVNFQETVEYVLARDDAWSGRLKTRLAELGGEVIDDDVAVLGFGNFVGRTSLAGAYINVVSSKIGELGVSDVLAEISRLSATLLFSANTPTGFEAALKGMGRAPVPYHQLQVLRDVMLAKPTGARLQDWLDTIVRNPTRRFHPERPLTPIGRVKRLDPRAVRTIFARVDRLSGISAESDLARNHLAVALSFGDPPRPHFPHVVAAPRPRLSFDTPENRFVRHVVHECLAVVHRFVDHPRLSVSLRRECREMLAILLERAEADFLAEAGSMSSLGAPSQALTKSEGYRDVLAFWNGFIRHVSLPDTDDETTRLLEGRDMARLYEYWVFLKVLEAVTKTLGSGPKRVAIQQDEFGDTLVAGLATHLGEAVSVSYNPTFKRSGKAGQRAYSTPLRPDVVLAVGAEKHGFDAKYRLSALDRNEADTDDDEWTYKRADLYKMHTYRDAIDGMASAFVVYPGSEFVFFDRTSGIHLDIAEVNAFDGVGAVPLRPAAADRDEPLGALVERILTQPRPTA